ncbi:FtsX-like permease family protein [Entomoplasma freundtii]|uniref:ABC3 transporter permease C-terminal domain-containing protein n=1 Tax=Entomoplasma freundtii TaxID=74700 RepID=A0A2K8NQB2_9MOLU|nr:ABC transporter permease [Entomoplasma freundtii]ATZ16032.1 hypothetical protein EFREU_v1c00050 [Entomoplasma freundtii]TDY58099.1 FtsX-like permease family protein [Entomoplasma freundtii]
MTWAIFRKQTFRNLKNNWSIIALIFAFVIIGVSLAAGVSSYLFNAYHFTVERGFKNGSFDAMVIKNGLRWDEQQDSQPQDLFLTKNEQEKFEEIVKTDKTNDFTTEERHEIYRFVLAHEGYIQSLLYDANHPSFIQGNNIKVIQDWLNDLKQFNGNLLAYYLYYRTPEAFDKNWDVRTHDLFLQRPTTFLDKEVDIELLTYNDNWVKNPNSYKLLNNGETNEPSLFRQEDFTYNLGVSYDEYQKLLSPQAIHRPLFVTDKSLKNFNLKIGQELIIVNKEMPPDKRLDKYIIVGTAIMSSNMMVMNEYLTAFMPFNYFWDQIQSQENYIKFEIYISTNQDSYKGFPTRYKKVEQRIRDANIFRGQSGLDKSEWPSLINSKPPGSYYAYYTFWISNISIVVLVIVSTIFLIFFVILFTTNQLIENNKRTLQFLKCLGFGNAELSFLNMANVLLPIFLGLLIGFPFSFVIQNLISFLLESQYPMVLNYWMISPWMILIYIAICLFVLAIFFVTNFIVLSRHNILEVRESKIIKHIKSGRLRQWVYNHVSTNTKIAFAINGANIRKSVITTIVLTVTYSVILFGVGFKESINYQGRSAIHYYAPYKNYSLTESSLFTVPSEQQPKDNDQPWDWRSSQDPLLLGDDDIEENSELKPINDGQDVLEALRDGPYNYYLTSAVIDNWVSSVGGDSENPFEEALEKLQAWLKENGIAEGVVTETLKSISVIYDNYQNLKLQLSSLYDWDWEAKDEKGDPKNKLYFIAGRFIATNTNGRTMSLEAHINQRVKGNTPPNSIQGIGLLDTEIQQKMGLSGTNDRYLNVKLSQSLANKLGITKTELAFNNPTFDLSIPLNRNTSHAIKVRARVVEIIKSEFVDDRIFYGINNLKALLRADSVTVVNKDNDQIFNDQFLFFKTEMLADEGPAKDKGAFQFANGIFSEEKVPNALRYVTLPLNYNDGSSINDFADGGDKTELVVSDYKLLALMIADVTKSYMRLINNITIIFVLLTAVVALLLTYLFLVKNRANILLFKSLGYSTPHISNFMIWGYLLAAIIGVGLAIGISVLVVSLLGTVFNDAYNITITFTFTWRYSILIVALPIIFIVLILGSLGAYTYRQDPKDVLVYG